MLRQQATDFWDEAKYKNIGYISSEEIRNN
jgi:hypothetical protein